MEMDGEGKGETLQDVVWIPGDEEEERSEEGRLCFLLSRRHKKKALNHFMVPEWKCRSVKVIGFGILHC